MNTKQFSISLEQAMANAGFDSILYRNNAESPIERLKMAFPKELDEESYRAHIKKGLDAAFSLLSQFLNYGLITPAKDAKAVAMEYAKEAGMDGEVESMIRELENIYKTDLL